MTTYFVSRSSRHVTATATATSTSSSYSGTFTASVPLIRDPYYEESDDKNGTVFIAVGTIIIALFGMLLTARFVYWLKNRKAAKDATKFDEDYYYGNGSPYHDNNSVSFLNYDSSYFDEKKSYYGISSPSSSDRSHFTHSSAPSTTSTADSINTNHIDNLASQPGRHLRSALTQTYVPPRNRNSFISPINELINESLTSFPQENANSAGSNGKSLQNSKSDPSTINPSSTTDSFSSADGSKKEHRRRKTQSISILFNGSPNLSSTSQVYNTRHSKSTSVDLHELEKMIHEKYSAGSGNATPNAGSIDTPESRSAADKSQHPSKNSAKKHNRPPSVVLDMLVQQEMDLQ